MKKSFMRKDVKFTSSGRRALKSFSTGAVSTKSKNIKQIRFNNGFKRTNKFDIKNMINENSQGE